MKNTKTIPNRAYEVIDIIPIDECIAVLSTKRDRDDAERDSFKFNKLPAEMYARASITCRIGVGTQIRILHFNGEDDSYDGREGTIEYIDALGQLHGTWGSLAVIPGIDKFAVLLEADELSASDRGTGGHGSTGR